MTPRKINVLVVDDSAVVRQVLASRLSKDPAIHVLDTVSDPLFALQSMERHWPDVIVLDIEMPRMDGISFLRRIMAQRPTPVVICSSLAKGEAETTREALAAGAVTVVPKPTLGLRKFLENRSGDIVEAVKAAARADIRARLSSPPESPPLRAGEFPAMAIDAQSAMVATTDKIVAIGTSAGGTQALERVLGALPKLCPGLVIVQHMPQQFTAAFAARLNDLSEMEVLEARSGDRIMSGRALIAPGGRHMQIRRNGAQYQVEVFDGPLVNRHRPSVDVLFRSVARHAGRNALGIIMTGMGDDGARGLKEMRDAGAHTIAQDERSCVVFGMPREAIRMEAASEVLPLDRIPPAILNTTSRI